MERIFMLLCKTGSLNLNTYVVLLTNYFLMHCRDIHSNVGKLSEGIVVKRAVEIP